VLAPTNLKKEDKISIGQDPPSGLILSSLLIEQS
jgi:hypothetical protein